jgi:hypothetical protein
MTAKQRPTRRQLEVLRAYIAVGSIAAAAYELGITETTARRCGAASQPPSWRSGIVSTRLELGFPSRSCRR